MAIQTVTFTLIIMVEDMMADMISADTIMVMRIIMYELKDFCDEFYFASKSEGKR